MLVQDDIIWLWCEVLNNVRIPSVSNEDATLFAVWRMDHLPGPQQEMSSVIRRITRTSIRHIRTKRHLQVHDLDSSSPGGAEGPSRGLDSSPDHRNIDPRSVKHAAFGSE